MAAGQLHLQPSEIDGETYHTITVRERTGLVAWLRRRIDRLDDPKPVYERSRTESEGMTQKEWVDWLSLHAQHEEYKERLREQERRKNQ